MITLNVGKKRTLTLSILPAGAQVVGVPVWTVAPVGGLTMFPSADGMSCDVIWASILASQTVTVTANPAPASSPPAPPLTTTLQIQTLAPLATGLAIAVGPEV